VNWTIAIVEDGAEGGAKLSERCAELCLPTRRCLWSHDADLREVLFFW